LIGVRKATLEDGDPALIAAALGDMAHAKGMSEIARKTGLGRESLYKALSPDGNPEFSSVPRSCEPLAFGCTRRLTFSGQLSVRVRLPV
jgi:probable addiction module antidote protein